MGQTIQPVEYRWDDHYDRAANGTEKLYSAMRKYTDKEGNILTHEYFDFNTKEEIITHDFDVLKAKLNEREIFWIAHYDSHRNGYNMTMGGQDGKYSLVYYKSAEVMEMWNTKRCTISHLIKEFNCAPSVIKNILINNDVTEEEINQRGDFFINTPISVAQIEIPSGNIIANFESANQAEKSTGITHSSILCCCDGFFNHAGYYFWRRTDSLTKKEINNKKYEGKLPDNINGRKYDHNKIIKLVLEGLTDEEVAERVGCNRSRVVVVRNQNGLAPTTSIHRKIVRIHPKTKEMKIYDSVIQAERENGVRVDRALQTGGQANGFFYKRLTEISESDLKTMIYSGFLIDKKKQMCNPIICENRDGSVLRFYSITQAANWFKCSHKTIRNILDDRKEYFTYTFFSEWQYLEKYKLNQMERLKNILKNKTQDELSIICQYYGVDFNFDLEHIIKNLANHITEKHRIALITDEENRN